MKQRLASPSDVIDLGKIKELVGIELSGDTLTIKAATTYYDILQSADAKKAIPAIAHLTSMLGDPAVRHRGTIGGSIANNDPAADYPAAVLALGATVKTNKRSIAADDFFKGLFSTALEDGEIITAVVVPGSGQGGICQDAPSGLALRADRRVRRQDQSRRRPRRRDRRLAKRRDAGTGDRGRVEGELVGGGARRRQDFRRRAAGRYPRIGGLSRQSDQGDGAARGGRRRLIALSQPTAARSDARRLHFAIGQKGLPRPLKAGQFHRKRQWKNNVLDKSAPQSSTRTSGPLAGYRIVEFAGIGPGPFACMMLADMGAEVVTLDRVGARKNLKSVAGRGRKVVELDLKDKARSPRCSICWPMPTR